MVVLIDGKRVLKVDAHTHILPSGWASEEHDIPLRLVRYDVPNERGFAAKLEYKDSGKLFRELKPNCFDADIILEECDKAGVDVQVCCTVPVMFNYHMPAEAGVKWAKFLNDDIAITCNARPDRLVALGTLPLQDSTASVAEVGRCVALGIRGFQVGSHINAYRGVKSEDGTANIEMLPLNHKDLWPVWRECERLGACIMVHPWDMQWWCNNEYWQPWLIGMPSETALAGTALILGGVLSAFPGLKVMMSHGGGALPYLMGRIDWGYRCRPDLVAIDCPEIPSKLVKRLYFDSITHDERMLKTLVSIVGPERVMLGSDYPFPLGEVPSVAPGSGEVLTAFPGELIQSSTLSAKSKEALLGGTALEWLGFDAAAAESRFMCGENKKCDCPAQLLGPDATPHCSSDEELLSVFVVDAFSTKPFSGNPAAVVLLSTSMAERLTDVGRKQIAAQMNLSETAFVTPINAPKETNANTTEGQSESETLDFRTSSHFNLRWFTPDGTEVNLCGHATLATAATLLLEQHNTSYSLHFHTLSGELVVARANPLVATLTSKKDDVVQFNGAGGLALEMVLPNNCPVPVKQCSLAVQETAAALVNVVTKAFSSTASKGALVMQDVLYSAPTKKLLLRLPDAVDIDSAALAWLHRGVTPALPQSLRAAHLDGSIVKGVIISIRTSGICADKTNANDASTTSSDSKSYDFQSRYFAPWVGIPEDPVTGSAHTVAGPFWAQELGRNEDMWMSARQCSVRGGDLRVRVQSPRLQNTDGGGKVVLQGTAAVTLRGKIAFPRF